MPPQSMKPTKKSPLTKLRSIRIPKKLLLVIFLLIVIGVGGYYGYKWITNRKPATSAYTHSYSKLIDVKLPGDKAGSGLSFIRPADLQSSSITEKSTQVSMFQFIVKNNHPVVAMEIAAASVRFETPFSAEYLKQVDDQLTDPNNSQHLATAKSIQDFVSQRVLAPNYSITFSEPKKFNANSIKNNIWYVSYEMTAKETTKKTNLNTPDMQGEAILAIGKSTFYYYKLDMLKVNWQSSQSTRDQITNSIKIDQ